MFEDLQSDASTFATVSIPIYVAYDTDVALPGLGSGTVSAALAPVSTVTTADPNAPSPRFAFTGEGLGGAAFTINPCSCASNTSPAVSVTRGGFSLNFGTHRYQQVVTIQNTGTSPIAGPISLVLDNLADATLANQTGVTVCAASGPPYIAPTSPYITVNAGNALAPGASSSVVLQFTPLNSGGIFYSARVVGAGHP